ncbi:SAM-dependent methyltransferase [Legionella busanensis]|uniref:SAM-dependent methyltransferase n=1 Tax=Legionella busanensis TaxID=190655 RepID=A0A378JNT6_9GAMM|nr:class I SAM-dependent rRNA methyltransferase [Legionella busanensis]STX51859.1 SAM-dependent methyltransferase [Legionella busanensis]
MRPVVYLNPEKQHTMRRGHPWIFPKAISKTQGKLKTGEFVDVVDLNTKERLSLGVYNEHSLYRVRILAQSWEVTTDFTLSKLLAQRFKQALAVRKALNLPNQLTNAFRLFNSEADGLSGLTIDYFNQVCVVSSSAYWVELHKDEITAALKRIVSCERIIWFAQQKPLKQDGWDVIEEVSREEFFIDVSEAGIIYKVNFANAQKTGLFLDQRENHERIAHLAHDKRVLDLYTYTGGFALHAAHAGAKHVLAVDSSAPAISQAKQNAIKNNLANVEFIEGDARDYLSQAHNYDLVILDPPKLVPSKQHLQRAKNYYRFLHRELFNVMQSGSLLMTCNCSSALSTAEFVNLIQMQALAVQKQVRILGTFGPASCHPTLPSFPEGNYLTAVLVAIV